MKITKIIYLSNMPYTSFFILNELFAYLNSFLYIINLNRYYIIYINIYFIYKFIYLHLFLSLHYPSLFHQVCVGL